MSTETTPASIGADALRVAAQAALTALENLHEIDTETECITIDVRDEIDALRAALVSAAQPAAVPHAQMTEEIDNILSDPDTRLSPGAERALSWLRTWTDAPLVLAAAPKAAQMASDAIRDAAPAAQGDAEDAARYRCWRDAMIEDVGLQFTKAVSRALPDAVGVFRRPTAHEWDAAIDAARVARSQTKNGA